MKIFSKIYLIVFSFLFVNLQKALAFSFEKDSGITQTAEETGHDSIIANGDLQETLALGIRMFLGLLGLIFLVLSIYAGFIWMNARGNAEDVERAKKILSRSIIGLVIILASYAATAFVVEALIQ